MENNPYESPQQAPKSMTAGGGGALSMEAIMPLYKAKGWMKLFGIVNIVIGVLYCLTIVGLVFGWLPIWMGVVLSRAATNLERGVANGSPGEIREASSNLGTFFTILGVITIIWLALMALYIVGIILMMAVAVVGGTASQMQ